ncbi:hypothetical protein [Paenacidovorax monticola]|uniref:Tryptophan synthase subunit beta like protein n=1 Tax=Paenacidovorax monticola TaxID=1926868 RepID=A0A7H0HBD0_9BURK|nr:hypothetical protein [Paenacidovorax monticola]MBO9678482.1 hypothetical protein [Acidovorax sp.]QNP57846.1 hypothetical protein H9L24_11955 [Paenacidovorax monticola]
MPLPPQNNPLIESDADLARVTEDLVNLLVQKGVILFTDLPPGAQAKLLARQQTRANMVNSLKLLGEDSEDGLI